jgi:hypothetical protein
MMKFALRPSELLRDAIGRHRREHAGRQPLWINLHPAVLSDLLGDAAPWQIAVTDKGAYRFEGVEIREDRHAIQPTMTSVDRKVSLV